MPFEAVGMSGYGINVQWADSVFRPIISAFSQSLTSSAESQGAGEINISAEQSTANNIHLKGCIFFFSCLIFHIVYDNHTIAAIA